MSKGAKLNVLKYDHLILLKKHLTRKTETYYFYLLEKAQTYYFYTLEKVQYFNTKTAYSIRRLYYNR